MVILTHLCPPQLKRHLDRFRRFRTVHDHVQQTHTDRHTDTQTTQHRWQFFALRAYDAANWNRPMWHFRDFMQNFKRKWTRIQWSDVTIICSLHNSTAVDENDKIPPKQHWDIRITLAESSNSYLKSAQSNAQFTLPGPTRQNYRVSSLRRCDWILDDPGLPPTENLKSEHIVEDREA